MSAPNATTDLSLDGAKRLVDSTLLLARAHAEAAPLVCKFALEVAGLQCAADHLATTRLLVADLAKLQGAIEFLRSQLHT